MVSMNDRSQRKLDFSSSETYDWSPSAPPSLSDISTVELDTETTGLNWRSDRPIGISIALPGGKSWYLPWGHKGGNLDEETVRRWARAELRGKRIVGANIKFDIHMLREWGVDLEAQGNTFSDVLHYAALLDDHRRKCNLEEISRDFLNEGKVGGLDKSAMADYHAAQVHEYAEQDAVLVQRLRHKMEPLLHGEDLDEVVRLEDDVIPVVVEMEKNGAPIDEEKLAVWIKQSEQAEQRALWSIWRDTGVRVEPEKPTTLIKLFESLKIPISHWTAGGKPSFTDDVLKWTNNPVVERVRHARKLANLRSKYLLPYTEKIQNGILPYSLHPLRVDEGGTITGRFSASNVNIQQVPAVAKQIETFGGEFIVRELFIPSRGYLWFSSDAKQIEYRLFAHHASTPAVLAAYASNPETDYHALIGEILSRFKVFPRKQVKNINFAKIYGAGKAKIAAMTGLPRDESDEFVNLYDRMFPEVAVLLNRASRAAETRGFVRTLMGRRMRFPNKERCYKALNGIIQGSAADINKKKLVELHNERKNTGFVMRLTVHDEVCGDVPDLEAAKKVSAILDAQSFPLKVPILWDANTGKNWAECK